MEEIAQTLSISHGSISTILHDRIGMRNLTARWVPNPLAMSKWQPEHQYAAPCSSVLDQDDFLLRPVTVDETWFIIMSQRIKLRVVSR